METGPPPSQPLFKSAERNPHLSGQDQALYVNESPERYWAVGCTWGARRKLAIVCDELHVPKQRDCGFVWRKLKAAW